MLNTHNDKISDWTTGSLDGKATEFRYAAERNRLEFMLPGEGADQLEYFNVQDIVGVLPLNPGNQGSEYYLLHVSNKSSPGNYGSLESANVKNLPSSFIEEFSPSLIANVTTKTPILLHVLVSVGSGNQRAEQCFASLVEPLLGRLKTSLSVDCVVVRTTSATTISEYTTKKILPYANEGRKQSIMLLSGDGGVVDLINALALKSSPSLSYTKPTVALIPLGTANALATSLHVAEDTTMGLSTWYRGTSKPLPAFVAKFSDGAELVIDEGSNTEPCPRNSSDEAMFYGSVVCSWGLHASLVADSDNKEYRKLGSSRFEKAANALLYPPNEAGPHRYKAKVSLLKADKSGNATWRAMPEDTHVYVLVTLVSNLEKTFTISPETEPLDGQLRLIYIRASNGDEIMRLMNCAYDSGKHVHDPNVIYEEVEGLKIDFDGRETCDRWRRVCIDGKIFIVEPNGSIEVMKNAKSVVDIFVPRK